MRVNLGGAHALTRSRWWCTVTQGEGGGGVKSQRYPTHPPARNTEKHTPWTRVLRVCTSRELGTSLASNCCVQLLNVRVSGVEENKSTQATFVLRVAD